MPAYEYQCRVTRTQALTSTVFEVGFIPEPKLADAPAFQFQAGQFISLVVPGAGPGGRDLRRAYSIASPPEQREIELCVKRVIGGPGTEYLYRLKEGDVFRALAPYGDFVFETPQERQACFVATGTGIAPFRSMVQSQTFLLARPSVSWCLMGVRSEDELVYVNEFSKIPGMNWISCVSRPVEKIPPATGFFSGRVTDALRGMSLDFNWANTDFYLCGNGAMIKEVKALLEEKGVLKEHIFQEKYY